MPPLSPHEDSQTVWPVRRCACPSPRATGRLVSTTPDGRVANACERVEQGVESMTKMKKMDDNMNLRDAGMVALAGFEEEPEDEPRSPVPVFELDDEALTPDED